MSEALENLRDLRFPVADGLAPSVGKGVVGREKATGASFRFLGTILYSSFLAVTHQNGYPCSR
jgi:hypothetical protein